MARVMARTKANVRRRLMETCFIDGLFINLATYLIINDTSRVTIINNTVRICWTYFSPKSTRRLFSKLSRRGGPREFGQGFMLWIAHKGASWIMSRPCKNSPANFEAKVSSAVFREDAPIFELAAKYEVYATVIHRWKFVTLEFLFNSPYSPQPWTIFSYFSVTFLVHGRNRLCISLCVTDLWFSPVIPFPFLNSWIYVVWVQVLEHNALVLMR